MNCIINFFSIDYITDILGKICIPIIIGAITFIIAKKQITNAGVTQFRQKWINDLRDSISLFIAKAEMISVIDLDDNENYYRNFTELAQTQHKILLLLNPLENDHKEIGKVLDEIRDLIHEEDISDDSLDEEMDKKINELIKISQAVLKREWNVVKSGK